MKESVGFNRKEHKHKSYNEYSFKMNLDDESNNLFFFYDYDFNGKSIYTLKNMLKFLDKNNNNNTRSKTEKVLLKYKENKIQLPPFPYKFRTNELEISQNTKPLSKNSIKNNFEIGINTDNEVIDVRNANLNLSNNYLNEKHLLNSKSIFSNFILENACNVKENETDIYEDNVNFIEQNLPKIQINKNFMYSNHNKSPKAQTDNYKFAGKNVSNANGKNFILNSSPGRFHNFSNDNKLTNSVESTNMGVIGFFSKINNQRLEINNNNVSGGNHDHNFRHFRDNSADKYNMLESKTEVSIKEKSIEFELIKLAKNFRTEKKNCFRSSYIKK